MANCYNYMVLYLLLILITDTQKTISLLNYNKILKYFFSTTFLVMFWMEIHCSQQFGIVVGREAGTSQLHMFNFRSQQLGIFQDCLGAIKLGVGNVSASLFRPYRSRYRHCFKAASFLCVHTNRCRYIRTNTSLSFDLLIKLAYLLASTNNSNNNIEKYFIKTFYKF